MIEPGDKQLRVFYSYSREDEEYLKELRNWLIGLKRKSLIEEWYDRMIGPGENWEEAIEKNLKSSDIIIVLVSQSLLSSDFAWEKEISPALEKHKRGEARVIPIIVRPALWEQDLGGIQALPEDGEPIIDLPNRERAWRDVAAKIQKEVQDLADEQRKHKQVTALVRDVLADRPQREFQTISQEREGIAPFQVEGSRQSSESRGQTSALKSEFRQRRTLTNPGKTSEANDRVMIDYLNRKTIALYERDQLEEATKMNDAALTLSPNDPRAWYSKGLILAKKELHDEALDAFREADDRRRDYPEAWSAGLSDSSERNGVA